MVISTGHIFCLMKGLTIHDNFMAETGDVSFKTINEKLMVAPKEKSGIQPIAAIAH